MLTRFQDPHRTFRSSEKPTKRATGQKKVLKAAKAPADLISVIIPAHNEESYILETLKAVRAQSYPWIELIVVANGCTDATAEEARGHCDRLIVLSQKSLGVARNLGARMAQGRLLVFLDADTILEPTALAVIARDFRKGDAAGTIRGEPDCANLRYKLLYALKNFVHCSSLHSGSSGVIICWKKHFEKTGGFDEGLEVRENSELMWRLKRFGKYKYIGDARATTSMRRYQQCGLGPMLWLWVKLWFLTRFGDLHRRQYETVR